MEGQEIIRACMLEPGNIFKRGRVVYKVSAILDGRIHYAQIRTDGRKNSWVQIMGANSREKLILITNKTKQNEHQN